MDMRGWYTLMLWGCIGVNAFAAPAFADPAPPPSAGAPEDSTHLEEIIVTANKRSENSQKVPISISSITQSSLSEAGIESTNELSSKVAGLTVQESGNGLQSHIRGIGTSDVVAGNESSVATYVDGVYISVLSGSMLSLTNIAQVDVLKGPQGTLFGRNATGGVVDIRTKDPTQDLHYDASLSYGTYDTTSASVYVTGGLSDHVAADLAAYGLYQGTGFGQNLATGNEVDKTSEYSLRTKWLVTPTDWLRIRLTADKEQTNDDGLLAYKLVPGTSVNRPGQAPFVPTQTNPWDLDNAADPHWLFRQQGVSSRIDVDTAVATVTSISAYRTSFKYNAWNVVPLPTPVPEEPAYWREKGTEASQEIQIASLPSSPFTWVVGGYFLYSKVGYDPFVITGPAVDPLSELSWRAYQQTDASALYGQTMFPVATDTHLTLGFRYSVERKAVTGDEAFDFFPSSGIPSFDTPTDAHTTFRKPTWRLALDHQFTPSVLGYISYNRGFKSGVYATIPPGGPGAQPVKPETIDAYEVGIKSDVLNDRVRVNAAAYYYNYKEIQVDVYESTSAVLENGGAAKLYGLDLDATAKLANHLSLDLGAAYVHDRFTQFDDGALSVLVPVADGGGRKAIPNINLAGNRIPYTPDYTANVGLTYTLPLSDGELSLNANYAYNSGFYGGADNTYGQGAYSVVNAQVGWTFKSGTEIKFWGRNLSNAAYATFLPFQNNPGGFTDEILAHPRTVGVAVAFRK